MHPHTFNPLGSIPCSLLCKSLFQASKSPSFPNAFIGNPGGSLTGPPIKTFGGDKFGTADTDTSTNSNRERVFQFVEWRIRKAALPNRPPNSPECFYSPSAC